MDENKEPLFALCSVGKNRWFWVTYRDFVASCNRDIDDSGYAPSAEDAEKQARASIEARLGQASPDQVPAYFASGVHHRRAVKQRANRSSEKTDTQEIEYLYTDYEGDYTDGSHAHRIVKKTAKRVYITRQPTSSRFCDETWKQDGQTYHEVKTVVLDRHELEAEGCAYSRRRRQFFHTTPWEERHRPRTPRWLEILGLEDEATVDAVKTAYRGLAKSRHPDHGGNAQEFKELQAAYEMAMGTLVTG